MQETDARFELKCIQITLGNIKIWKKHSQLQYEKKTMQIIWCFPETGCQQSLFFFSFFKMHACNLFQFLTFFELSSHDSKRFIRLLEWQYMPKLFSRYFSKCFRETQSACFYSAMLKGWMEGWTKRCFFSKGHSNSIYCK